MNVFNAALNILTVSPVNGDTTKWDITANVIDNTGVFGPFDAKVGTAIYNNCSLLGIPAVRFKITAVDPATDFLVLKCTIQWDMPEAQPVAWSVTDYPNTNTFSIIGDTDDIGTIAITSMSVNLVDESFITAVRNAESFRVSRYLSLSNPSIKTGTVQSLQYHIPSPDANGEILVGSAPDTLTWETVLDPGTF
jgi:hypothetical protein